MRETGKHMRKIVCLVFLVTMIITALAVTASAQPDEFDDLDTGELALFSGICLTIIIIMWVIFILIAIWVYKDAEKRGKSGALWLIIVILLGIIGIIIWLVVRPPIVQGPGGPPMQPGYPPQQPYYPPQQQGYPPQQQGYPPQQPPQQPPQ